MSSDVASDDDASDASRFVCVTLGCTGKVSKGQHSAIISEKDGSDTFLASSGELQGHDGILTGDSVTVLLIQTFASPTCPFICHKYATKRHQCFWEWRFRPPSKRDINIGQRLTVIVTRFQAKKIFPIMEVSPFNLDPLNGSEQRSGRVSACTHHSKQPTGKRTVGAVARARSHARSLSSQIRHGVWRTFLQGACKDRRNSKSSEVYWRYHDL